MTLVLASIATDADLAAEYGGTARLNSLQSDVTIRDSYRASALQDVVDSLSTRTPPVTEGNLSDPTELKQAVVYRTLAKLCAVSITEDRDRHHVLSRKYDDDYRAAVQRRFSVTPGVSSSSGRSFSFERR